MSGWKSPWQGGFATFVSQTVTSVNYFAKDVEGQLDRAMGVAGDEAASDDALNDTLFDSLPTEQESPTIAASTPTEPTNVSHPYPPVASGWDMMDDFDVRSAHTSDLEMDASSRTSGPTRKFQTSSSSDESHNTSLQPTVATTALHVDMRPNAVAATDSNALLEQQAESGIARAETASPNLRSSAHSCVSSPTSDTSTSDSPKRDGAEASNTASLAFPDTPARVEGDESASGLTKSSADSASHLFELSRNDKEPMVDAVPPPSDEPIAQQSETCTQLSPVSNPAVYTEDLQSAETMEELRSRCLAAEERVREIERSWTSAVGNAAAAAALQADPVEIHSTRNRHLGSRQDYDKQVRIAEEAQQQVEELRRVLQQRERQLETLSEQASADVEARKAAEDARILTLNQLEALQAKLRQAVSAGKRFRDEAVKWRSAAQSQGTASTDLQELQERFDLMMDEAKQLAIRQSAQEQEIKAGKQELRDKDGKIAHLEGVIEQARLRETELNSELTTLKRSSDAVQSSSKATSDAKAALESQLQRSAAQVASLTAEVAALSSAKERLHTEVVEQRKVANDALLAVEAAEAAQQQAELRVHEYEEMGSSHHRQLHLLQEEVAQLRATLSRAEQERAEAEDDLRQQLDAARTELQMTLERLQDVETSNSTSGGSEDLMQQLHRLQSALSDARRKHADQLNGASLRSTQLADEVSSLRKSCNELEAAKAIAVTAQCKLETELQAAKQAAGELKAERQQMADEKASMSATLGNLQRQGEQQLRTIRHLEANVARLTRECRELSTTLQARKSIERELRDQLAHAERSVGDSEGSAAGLESVPGPSVEVEPPRIAPAAAANAEPATTIDISQLLLSTEHGPMYTERIRSALRSTHRKCVSLQNHVRQLETNARVRDQQLVHLNRKLVALSASLRTQQELQQAHDDLLAKQDVLLELLGEREEELEELRSNGPRQQ